jgi:hypothetical protein
VVADLHILVASEKPSKLSLSISFNNALFLIEAGTEIAPLCAALQSKNLQGRA